MDDAEAEEEREAQKKHKELAEARAAEEARKQRKEQAAAAAREKQEELATLAAEEARKKEKELAKSQAAEEARKKQEELAKALAEEAKKKQEELAKAAAEEARKKQKELAEAQAEEARKKQEELAKAAAEEAKKKQKELPEAQAAEEARKKQEELAKAQAAEETRKQQEELASLRRKKEQLEMALREVDRLNQELQQGTQDADETMQSLQEPRMPGPCKNETPSPKPQLLGGASMPSNASLTTTQSESSQNSQDAQDPWAIQPQRLFQSPSAKHVASPPPVSTAAINKRLSRAMEPTSKGVFRVAESIRKQWQAGGASKEGVIRLFAAPASEELSKLLKRFQYPEIQDAAKPSTLLAKAILACQKRLKKLEELMPDDKPPPPEENVDDSAGKGSVVQRSGPQLLKMYTQLDESCDRLIQCQTDGVVDGYDDELSACIVGEVSQAAISDGARIGSLRDGAKIDKNHSERNAHRLFNKYGLALRIPISSLEVPATAGSGGQDHASVPHLRLTDMLGHLLNHHEEVLFGGLRFGNAAENLLSEFWARFQSHQKDHVIFESIPESERCRCVPIMIHGDKGRTLQKTPIMVLNFELAHGLPPDLIRKCSYDCKRNTRHNFDSTLRWTCARRASAKRKFAEMSFNECPRECPGKCFDHASAGSHHRHNNKGHSYLSRFLIAAVPSNLYKKNDGVIPGLLKMIAQQLQVLFEEGLVHSKSGSRLKFVFIGVKGDAEWHWEAAGFTRSYHKTGSVNYKCICPYCEAGAEGYSYTDVSDSPAWLQTVGVTDPWDTTPPLNEVPYASTFAAGLYKLDVFHVLKFGVFRDTVGSSIARLAFMRYWDTDDVTESCGVPERLNRAFAYYSMWCLAQNKNHTLKRFSRANMSYDKNHHFAEVHAKGSEVILLMTWLSFQLDLFLREPKDAGDVPILKVMKQMLDGGLTYVGIMHSHGTWLPHSCACLQLDAGMCFARGYAFLANHCTALQVPGTVQRYLVKVRLLLERLQK
ncbi:unnamed protein product [Symbiodinium sp. CCMP2592]|nr:unnamed protein product [Symbiodinium sp. CCMP2592]